MVRLCALMSQKLTAAMRGPLSISPEGSSRQGGRISSSLSKRLLEMARAFSADKPTGHRGRAEREPGRRSRPQDATPNVSQSVFGTRRCSTSAAAGKWD